MLLHVGVLLLSGATGVFDPGPVPEGTLRVLLVRHAQAYSNLQPPPALPPDQLDRLTDVGAANARRLAGLVRPLAPARVLVSPLNRTRQTAELLRAELGLPLVTVEPRLRPMELGHDDAGQELDIGVRWAEWKAGRDPRPGHGESLDDVAERVLRVLQEQRRAYGPGLVVAVSHSEVISSVNGRLRGRPAWERFPPQVTNCSLSVIDVAADGSLNLVQEACPLPVPEAVARQ
jgi:probable phosphoglycerate mutase